MLDDEDHQLGGEGVEAEAVEEVLQGLLLISMSRNDLDMILACMTMYACCLLFCCLLNKVLLVCCLNEYKCPGHDLGMYDYVMYDLNKTKACCLVPLFCCVCACIYMDMILACGAFIYYLNLSSCIAISPK
jgi:hypothetical protein